MTNRHGRSKFAAVLGSLGLGVLAGYIAAQPQESSERVFKPFVAEQRVLHSLGTQDTPISRAVVYARRSDGSQVTIRTMPAPDGQEEKNTWIHDMRRSRSVSLYSSIKASMTFYYSDEKMKRTLAIAQENCASPESAAALSDSVPPIMERMHGRQARRVLSNEPGRVLNGKRRDDKRLEAWVAEDLDCFPLRKTLSWSDGSMQQSTVTKLTEGEPPDSLFEIPPGYVEMSPLGIEAVYQAKYPGHPVFGQSVNLIQKRYEAAQAMKPSTEP